MTELEDLDHRVMWHPFTQMAEWDPLVIERGDGNFLVDTKGRRYLDGVASLWCNVHGHRHPRLDRALRDQLDRIAHSTFLGLTHEPGIRLGQALVDAAPAGLTRVFYSDSGSTAVEIALKQSFQYWQLRGRKTKQRFLRLGDAYHGDTLGAVGVGGIELFHRVFGPLLVQSLAIPSPADTDATAALVRLDAELATRADEIAAFVLEPLVQGAAGMLVHPPGFLREVATRCRAHDVHLIVDEVATGFGRTGTLFACEREQVSPDFLCLAKGIAAGYLPLAATLSTEEIYAAFLGRRAELKQFFHGHTFTANPLACAVGLESLLLLREETLPRAIRLLSSFEQALVRVRAVPGVRAVRSCGFMVGIEVESRVDRFVGAEVCRRARDHGVMLRPLGDVVVWMPPLSLSASELDLLETATSRAIEETLR
ncbi:MAG: adenosylmethionine--8-amino-7-oxononanoate transaminase [Deltaproteobacteria bacterium]|nr:adenosylmethionine--8-amino-7-oxononanoate transaminase [Deltaproteobacteria bacterium]MDQ3295023.1 adenosylmethionine--8-amino-7-oxononanoate transaminase [Myxococcota bacterium]